MKQPIKSYAKHIYDFFSQMPFPGAFFHPYLSQPEIIFCSSELRLSSEIFSFAIELSLFAGFYVLCLEKRTPYIPYKLSCRFILLRSNP